MLKEDAVEIKVNEAQPAELEAAHAQQVKEDASSSLPAGVVSPESDLPDNVDSEDALAEVPRKYLSNLAKRPLLLVDASGDAHTYMLRPWSCVVLILLMELLERLSFYGINFTQTAYLTGTYGPWSPELTSTEASSWVMTSTAVAYSIPFLGAIISDGFLGNYKTILLFSVAVYIPGLLIIALCTNESLFPSGVYPTSLLAAGLLGLYPIGAGGIKACVNVMGAQQFHPILQKRQVSRYYVWFYMFINIGALAGGIAIPIIMQSNVFAAYMIPVVGLSLGVIVFVLGTPLYVRVRAQGSDIVESLRAMVASCQQCPPSLEKTKASHGGNYDDIFIDKVKVIGRLVPIMLTVVPFNMAYGQMSNVFVIQGSVMQPVGFIDASWMQNFDAFSVLLSGFVLSTFVFPWLERTGRMPNMHTKFAIGSAFGALALIADAIIDYEIHAAFTVSGDKLCVLWQVFPFFLIGTGEIFAISSAYDAAFQLSPVGMKSFGSALNLFMIGAVPNFISEGILNACAVWFTTDDGSTDLSTLEAYSQAQVYNYLWVLVGIALLGVVVNLVPQVQVFYAVTEEKAAAITAKSV
ncbi:Protein NRT1/ PTR FAMILY 8.4 [Hondaea fermentalgiana]|uniref:Protein NRT1/ PTR FAMILY 8.4 n=1 Tax=Hondaea fermentalgiana TaxID=2315210 RepID=A0A2R5G670_9STRA|nr:Protein NRT1/ PTR FAMILY 8.4 [Hondaea fermentalgiana]|eukprot:GBG25278.1 Protein NRT1/ PTR FAMILY 8.4 [Hondaea fermentalgiana]